MNDVVAFDSLARLPSDDDNVAIATRQIEAGTSVALNGASFAISHTILEGHRFASQTIGDGTLHPPCMDTTCKVAVSERMIRKLAPASALDKFQRFSLAHMIEEHGLLKKCRTP